MTDIRLVPLALLILVKIATGLWLMRFRRVYPTGLLTAHKLVALAALALLAWIYLPLDPAAGALESAAVVATGVLFLVAILSGGLASIEKLPHRPLVIAHRVSTPLAILAAFLVIFIF